MMLISRRRLSTLLNLGLWGLWGCSMPQTVPPTAPARIPASVSPVSRYRSYFGEKLPVHGEDATCKLLPTNLRSMFYEQFLHLSESRGGKVRAKDAGKFAKFLALAWSQSHGNASQLVDSSGGGETVSTARFNRDNLRKDKTDHSAKTTLDSRRTLLTSPRVKAEKHTRVGLFQVRESDLEDSPGSKAQWKAIRELAARLPEEAADRCGTRWMYDNSERELAEAMTETAACKPDEVGCLRKWATLCPNLSLALELVWDDARLRKIKPVCAKAFTSLLRK